jgi:Tfp pilus assembly protein PilF
MKQKRLACFCLLAAALLMAGCAGPTIYGGLTDQRNEQAQSMYRDGLAHVGNQDHRAAIEVMKKAVMMEPALAEAYLGLSRSCFAVGDYDMAFYYHVKYAELEAYREQVYLEQINYFRVN